MTDKYNIKKKKYRQILVEENSNNNNNKLLLLLLLFCCLTLRPSPQLMNTPIKWMGSIEVFESKRVEGREGGSQRTVEETHYEEIHKLDSSRNII
jgi:hypothetical protein